MRLLKGESKYTIAFFNEKKGRKIIIGKWVDINPFTNLETYQYISHNSEGIRKQIRFTCNRYYL